MVTLVSFLQSSVAYAVPMIVLLGLLIFVHESGHFLVAKYFKVRVETFSLGFGPKILKFKRGDTVYAISALPLGGYVKMYGDDPTAEVDEALKAGSFTHKPVGQRIAVVLAGPLMNFFFAILLFAGVAYLGEQALLPKLGDIDQKSAAYQAGFRSGDTVVSVGTEPMKTWEEFSKSIEHNAETTLPVTVDRAGAKETFQITPKLITNKNVMSWDHEVGDIDGLSFSSKASIVGVRDEKSPAAIAGFKTGDMISSIDGVKVTKWRELADAFAKHTDTAKPFEIEVERGILNEAKSDDVAPETKVVKLSVPFPKAAGDDMIAKLGLEFPELYLAAIEKGSPAEKAGLQKADRLVSIDGKPLQSFEQVATLIRAYGKDVKTEDGAAPKPLDVVIDREGKMMNVALAPKARERMTEGREEKHFEIGIHPMVVEALPATFDMKAAGIVGAASRGVSQTLKWSSLTVLSFVRLFQAKVSPKNIGGFLSIGQMAKKSWAIGPAQFLNIMAIISINLFVLNLLPVPVLDGGSLVFFTVEALRGAPVSLRKMEIAQQVGLVLLLGLMVFALFNDVTRLFN